MAGLHTAIIDYKQRAISEMIQDEELVKAVNPYAESPENLVYKNIFPYFHVPETDVETLTYITVCIDYPEVYDTDTFVRNIVLKTCVIVHQDQMETDFGATKLDYISSRLDAIFSNSLKYGFGR